MKQSISLRERWSAMMQYAHTEQNERNEVHVSKFPYAGREVLLRHYHSGKSAPFVVVTGFISGDYKKQQEGMHVPVTDVEPVGDQAQRRELTDLLRKTGIMQPVHFWSDPNTPSACLSLCSKVLRKLWKSPP
jgi:hypothetical protein